MGSYKKKLFIVLLLTLLIGFFVCGSVNATMQDIQYSVDQPQLLKDQQEYLASVFIKRSLIVNNTDFLNTFKNDLSDGNFWFLFAYEPASTNTYINCYRVPISIRYENLDTYTINTDDAYFEDYFMSYPISGYSVSTTEIGSTIKRYRVSLTSNATTYSNYNTTFFIPSPLIMYNNKTCVSFRNGINPSDSSIAMIINAIQENTEEQEEQTEEMKKLNNFMSSEDVDEDAYDMPSENPTQDITESGINGIFTMFYDKINNWESENITIRIPFANKIFIIPSNLTEDIVNAYLPNTTTFGRLFGLIWYYLLGVYIVKDIQKYIDGLQTGEILTKSDTNIKTEML